MLAQLARLIRLLPDTQHLKPRRQLLVAGPALVALTHVGEQFKLPPWRRESIGGVACLGGPLRLGLCHRQRGPPKQGTPGTTCPFPWS